MALVAALGMATLFTGCGDDDNNNNNNNNTNGGGGNTRIGPQSAAELTQDTKTYNVTIGTNAPATFNFTGGGTGYTLADANGTEQGTISGLQATGTSGWHFVATPTSGDNTNATTVDLTFNAANAGTITVQSGSEAAENGTFTVTGQPSTNGGGGGGGNDLTNKTLQITYGNGGGEKFVFTSATGGTYENGPNTFTYTYNSTTGALHINGGANAQATYDMTLTFNSGSTTAGTTTVNYADPNGTTQDPATFTLQ